MYAMLFIVVYIDNGANIVQLTKLINWAQQSYVKKKASNFGRMMGNKREKMVVVVSWER